MHRFVKDLIVWTIALGIGAVPSASWAGKEDGGPGRERNACEKTARLARVSCKSAGAADLELETGKCVQSLERNELRECKEEAFDAFRETNLECREQHEARSDLCRALGEGRYAPELDPADFVATITNPFAPFAPGSHWVYEKEGEDGLERIEVDVLGETKSILGITATVVRDREFLDGELIEDTRDWLAQDSDGNVWYLGELSYRLENGVIVSLAGSWEAGVDGAQPGLWMKADPQVGDVYRQELLLGEAEDYGEVLSLNDAQTVPAGSFTSCLRTRDASPLEPGNEENKVYAPGVGLVVEIDPESGERAELIEYDLP